MNKYDDPKFFDKYAQMERSQRGLGGAGEWAALEPLLPDFNGRRVLDLGCGYGWHCNYAASRGAAQVIGIDSSAKMLKRAEELKSDPNISYQPGTMESFAFSEESFDIILSSLAIHYVADYAGLIDKCYRILSPGGRLVMTVEHPVFTSQGSQDWRYDSAGEIEHFPVDNYFYEGRRETTFLGETVTKYHRTLTSYLMVLIERGFRLQGVVEPMPPPDWLDKPGMADEMRRPMMLIIIAQKEQHETD